MNYQVCTNCVMDTTDPDIRFDSSGVCNHCHSYRYKVNQQALPADTKHTQLRELISLIKANQASGYDSIVGISGGVDSSYVALAASELGLNPLLVHFDNGWNSSIAVDNIRRICDATGFDLYTYVVNWNDFKNAQLMFFKSDVIDIEMLTDHAIKALLFHVATKFKIKYILGGANVSTESIMPPSWRHIKLDKSNILDIIGNSSIHANRYDINGFPLMGFKKRVILKQLYGIQEIKFLNLLDVNSEQMIERLSRRASWGRYPGKHQESIFTRFYQAYILPKKFNVDKRRAHLSCLINAGIMSRHDALLRLNEPHYPVIEINRDKRLVCSKLDFTLDSFEAYINRPARPHSCFKSDVSQINRALALRSLVSRIF